MEKIGNIIKKNGICYCFVEKRSSKNKVLISENGGEFLVEGLGYWIDGYDKENNIAYEYDEKYHFIGGELREKDKKRQKEIEEKLNCKFIRIKDGDYDYIFRNK